MMYDVPLQCNSVAVAVAVAVLVLIISTVFIIVEVVGVVVRCCYYGRPTIVNLSSRFSFERFGVDVLYSTTGTNYHTYLLLLLTTATNY